MALIDTRIVEKRAELEAANNELKLIEPMYYGTQGPLYVDFSGVDARSIKTKIAGLECDLSQLQALSEADQVSTLHQQAQEG
jgi:hypothetical protein